MVRRAGVTAAFLAGFPLIPFIVLLDHPRFTATLGATLIWLWSDGYAQSSAQIVTASIPTVVAALLLVQKRFERRMQVMATFLCAMTLLTAHVWLDRNWTVVGVCCSFICASVWYVPTCPELLEKAEAELLSFCKTPLRRHNCGPLHCIETAQAEKPTLVLIAGFGMGAATWFNVVDRLAERYHCVLLDRMCDGLSERSKPPADTSVQASEHWFINAIESWRVARGLQHFTLLGHSFGGYISAIYAKQHPEVVKHLILASPLGIPAAPVDIDDRLKLRFGKLFHVLHLGWEVWNVSPQGILRALGPAGPYICWTFYVQRRFAHCFDQDSRALMALQDYYYHNNVARPGYIGPRFLTMFRTGAFARSPLISRLDNLPACLRISLLYGGSGDWMGIDGGHSLADRLNTLRCSDSLPEDSGRRRSNCTSSIADKCVHPSVTVHSVPGAGHQLFMEQPDACARTLLQDILYMDMPQTPKI